MTSYLDRFNVFSKLVQCSFQNGITSSVFTRTGSLTPKETGGLFVQKNYLFVFNHSGELIVV